MSEVIMKGMLAFQITRGCWYGKSVCPWVNEDRFKRKWIFTDIKQSAIKAAQYNGVMVFFILMRVSVKGKRTGIKMLEHFHTPRKCVGIFFICQDIPLLLAVCWAVCMIKQPSVDSKVWHYILKYFKSTINKKKEKKRKEMSLRGRNVNALLSSVTTDKMVWKGSKEKAVER